MNLAQAVDAFESIALYDNSARGRGPRYVGEVRQGHLHAAGAVPDWVPHEWR